jgi:hypothetical protein
MKNFINILINILLYIWQILQNIGGLIVIAIMGYEKVLTADNGNKVYFSKKMPGGISLGKYSIISYYYTYNCKTDDEILALDVTKHEALGHGTQSRWLGPLYLPVVGLQSIIWAWMYGTIIPYTKNGYYKFWTEKWADKLGGVIRN